MAELFTDEYDSTLSVISREKQIYVNERITDEDIENRAYRSLFLTLGLNRTETLFLRPLLLPYVVLMDNTHVNGANLAGELRKTVICPATRRIYKPNSLHIDSRLSGLSQAKRRAVIEETVPVKEFLRRSHEQTMRSSILVVELQQEKKRLDRAYKFIKERGIQRRQA